MSCAISGVFSSASGTLYRFLGVRFTMALGTPFEPLSPYASDERFEGSALPLSLAMPGVLFPGVIARGVVAAEDSSVIVEGILTAPDSRFVYSWIRLLGREESRRRSM